MHYFSLFLQITYFSVTWIGFCINDLPNSVLLNSGRLLFLMSITLCCVSLEMHSTDSTVVWTVYSVITIGLIMSNGYTINKQQSYLIKNLYHHRLHFMNFIACCRKQTILFSDVTQILCTYNFNKMLQKLMHCISLLIISM